MLTRPIRSRPGHAPARQRGLSLVEMMVGVALGLVVVAATALMVSAQLGDNRRLLVETQLQQDMRVTLNTLTRELRRLGYTPVMAGQVWSDGKVITENPKAVATPGSGNDVDDLAFDYVRRPGEEGGFRFKLEAGAVKMNVQTALQAMTDLKTMDVQSLDIDWGPAYVTQLPCPQLCPVGTPGGDTGCWPEVQMRTLTISLTGRSATDTRVVRTMSSSLRLRNDWTRFNGAAVCPA